MKRPKVIVNCVAQHYAGTGERIIEFNSERGGGLIDLYDNGETLTVSVYNTDRTVRVLETTEHPS